MKKYLPYLALGIVLVALGALYFFPPSQDASSDQFAEFQIYEVDAENAGECASFETFDPERKTCSFECASEYECQDLQRRADDEFAAWTDELGQDQTPVSESKISDDADRIASYSVQSAERITLKDGEDKAEYQAIWNSIKSLSPDSLSNTYIETYEIFNTNDDTLAFVDDDDGNGKWRIAINLAGYKSSTERENKATIIHELGHIISLNTSQVDPDATNCPNLKLDEGCAHKDSAINAFWNKYWKGITNPEFDDNTFVTEYAASNETEDFAETFAFFVLGKDTGLSNSVKDQKIKLFYSFPELVAIRNEMRQALSTDIIRARKR